MTTERDNDRCSYVTGVCDVVRKTHDRRGPFGLTHPFAEAPQAADDVIRNDEGKLVFARDIKAGESFEMDFAHVREIELGLAEAPKATGDDDLLFDYEINLNDGVRVGIEIDRLGRVDAYIDPQPETPNSETVSIVGSFDHFVKVLVSWVKNQQPPSTNLEQVMTTDRPTDRCSTCNYERFNHDFSELDRSASGHLFTDRCYRCGHSQSSVCHCLDDEARGMGNCPQIQHLFAKAPQAAGDVETVNEGLEPCTCGGNLMASTRGGADRHDYSDSCTCCRDICGGSGYVDGTPATAFCRDCPHTQLFHKDGECRKCREIDMPKHPFWQRPPHQWELAFEELTAPAQQPPSTGLEALVHKLVANIRKVDRALLADTIGLFEYAEFAALVDAIEAALNAAPKCGYCDPVGSGTNPVYSDGPPWHTVGTKECSRCGGTGKPADAPKPGDWDKAANEWVKEQDRLDAPTTECEDLGPPCVGCSTFEFFHGGKDHEYDAFQPTTEPFDVDAELRNEGLDPDNLPPIPSIIQPTTGGEASDD